ncbi:MAG: MerR family transcriptional regulator [Bacteroidales bacterium]|nr:MerR family transcriptional regulator [Bacteroidales bacterium]
MEKLYYSIGEVAEALGESVSLVRFWSNSFPKLIKPQRNAKGNRQFTAADLETLKQIHYLVKDRGLTLEGAALQLSADRRPVDRSVKALESLKQIRAQLVEIKKNIS